MPPILWTLSTPRSRCPSCGHAITWTENIPLVSYVALRGRCKACKARIALRYPAIELLTGVPATIAAAEKALGYHAEYDAAADQFAHDAAIYVFAPDGTLSALLPETASTAPQLAAAIAGARVDRRYVAPQPKDDTSVLGRISAICYGLSAAHGVYVRPAVLALRLGGIGVMAAFAGFLLWSLRRQRRTA